MCISDKNSDLISCTYFYKSYKVSNNKIRTYYTGYQSINCTISYKYSLSLNTFYTLKDITDDELNIVVTIAKNYCFLCKSEQMMTKFIIYYLKYYHKSDLYSTFFLYIEKFINYVSRIFKRS